jgi:hypothetical protein
VDFTIFVNGAFQMTETTPSRSCTYVGSTEPRGRMYASQGSYVCTGNLPETGNYRITELEVGEHGVIGQIIRGAEPAANLPFARCTVGGRIAGVRPF